jgi:hypothetical protein
VLRIAAKPSILQIVVEHDGHGYTGSKTDGVDGGFLGGQVQKHGRKPTGKALIHKSETLGKDVTDETRRE